MDPIALIPSANTNITIKRIKTLSFTINELAIRQDEELLKAELGLSLGFSVEKNLIELKVRTYYSYPEDTSPVADITVQNIFEVNSLAPYLERPNFIVLPDKVIITLVGLSISHTRALLSQCLLGTPLQDSIMSILDPAEVAKHYFPYMFTSPSPIPSSSATPTVYNQTRT